MPDALDTALAAFADTPETIAGEQATPSYALPNLRRSLEDYAGQDEADQLRGTVEVGAKQKPATATRILQLTGKTGLPQDFIDRNLDFVEAEASRQDFNPTKLMRESPAFASWMAEHPDHVAAAKPDAAALSFIEKQLRNIPAQFKQGQRTVEYGDVMLGVVQGLLDKTDVTAFRKRQAELEAEMGKPDETGLAEEPGIAGVAQRAPGWMAQQMPILARTLAEQVKSGATGLAGGALLGGAVGGLPGAAIGGVAVGGAMWRIGAAQASAKMEFAQAFGEYEKLKDFEGKPLDQQTAMGLAGIVGVVNGTIDGFFGIEGLTGKLPGVNQFTRQGIKELLKTPTTARALLQAARTVGQTMGVEGVTEALQMYITKAGGVALEAVKNGGSPSDWIAQIFSPENLKQAATEAEAGAFGGGGIAAVMSTPQLAIDLRRVKQANQNKQVFEAIGTATAGTKFHVELPAHLREIIDRATKDGPVETLYVPAHAFNEYFQKEGVDPRAVYQEITGDVEAYDQSVETGMDLPIKTADYAAKLAGTKHNTFFAHEMRTSLDAMNGYEAAEWVQQQDELEKATAEQAGVEVAAVPDPGAAVRQDLAGQLLALGFDPTVVDQYAALFESRYTTRAQRRGLGETAADLFRQMNLGITRPVPAVLRQLGTTTELDALLDRLRAGDVPKETDVYGQSLVEFLKGTGGIADVGGELAARNVDAQTKPFTKKLMQKKGRTLDEAAQAAVEAGYLEERDINKLIEAIDQEVRGTPVYALGKENVAALDVKTNLESLKAYLEQRGVDLTTATNVEIKRLFGEAVQQPLPGVEGQTFAQVQPAAPTFFSKLEQVVIEKMGPKMPATDLRKMLVANGVKEEELKWTGLDDFLKGKGTVTKEEVAQFLSTHLVTVTPVVLGGVSPLTEEQFYAKYATQINQLKEMGWETTVLAEEGDAIDRVGFMTRAAAEEDEDDPGDILTWDDLPDEQPGAINKERLTDTKIKNALGPSDVFDQDTPHFRALIEKYYLPLDIFEGHGAPLAVYGFTPVGGDGGVVHFFKINRGNGIRFEVPVGGTDEEADTITDARRILYEEFVAPEILHLQASPFGTSDSPQEIAHYLHNQVENPPAPAGSAAPKFASYQMKPGEGVNYREVLLTLPTIHPIYENRLNEIQKRLSAISELPAAEHAARKAELTAEFDRLNAERKSLMDQFSSTEDRFLAGHYQVPNVLAHVRINDRVDEQGRKVMFVEEIQSDWHQKARDVRKAEVNRQAEAAGAKKGTEAFKEIEAAVPVDFGYRKKWKPEEVAKFKVLEPPAAETGGNEFGSITYRDGGKVQGDYVVIDGEGNVLATPSRSMNKTAQEALDLIKKSALAGTLHGMGKFPAAPFMKTEQWTALALKWLLRHAAEGGYDVMAWTPGAVQNTRYSLSKQVEQIRYEKNEDGTYHLWVKPIGSSEIDTIRQTSLEAVPVGGLADIVGKDVAEKIVEGFSSTPETKQLPAPTQQALGQETHWNGSLFTLEHEGRSYAAYNLLGRLALWLEDAEVFAAPMMHTGEVDFDNVMEASELENPRLETGELSRIRSALRDYDQHDTDGPQTLTLLVRLRPRLQPGEMEGGGGLSTRHPRGWDKVEAAPGNVITGLDLDVAGGGMKSFYDKLIPNVLKDIGKKWGAKVETVNLGPKGGAPATTATNPSRPVFGAVVGDVDEAGISGLENWPNGDEPIMAETQMRVGFNRYDVEVYLDQNGVHILGADENSEPFEMAATKEMGSFRHIRWETADEAKRAAEAMWGTTGASFFWEAMEPLSGLTHVAAMRAGDFGPVTDRSVAERGEAAPPQEVQGLPITKQMKEAVVQRGLPLFQGGDVAKGSITFGNQSIQIKLLEKADLSTFIHESGHLYLNELVEDAKAIEAVLAESRSPVQQQVLKDLDTLFDWLGITEGYKRDKRISTAEHEQFARGFEAYAMEGKSPSEAMRQVFAAFRQWLIQVYRSLTTAPLRVNLTRPVREVMDRMIATDEEIDRAAQEAEVLPLFTDAESAGMTPTQFAAYRETVAKASLTARETLQKQLMAQYQRQHAAWWTKEREARILTITASVNNQNEYVALAVLQTGKLPDGAELPAGITPMKLDRAAIKKQFGAAFLSQLPKGITMHKGMHPNTAAPLFGYQSGQELLLALANVRPKRPLIEAEADRQMVAEHGDMRVDGTMAEAARTAVLNSQQEQVIAAEIRALNAKQREVAPFVKAAAAEAQATEQVGRRLVRTMIPTLEETRELARKIIGRMPLKVLEPTRYAITARQASRQATAAMLKKDYLDAGHFKQQELLNLALYREAQIVRERIQEARELFAGFFQADATLAKTRNVDLVNVGRAMLAQYGLGRPTEKTAAEYLAPIKTYDQDLYNQWKQVIDALAPRPLDYRALTIDELTRFADDLQSLWLLSRRTQQMKINEQLVDRQEIIDELSAVMAGFTKKQQDHVVGAQTPWADTRMGLLSWKSALRRVESWVDAMDRGNIAGAFRRYLWTPISEAADTFRTQKRMLLERYLEIVKPIEKTITRELIPAPELGPNVAFRGRTALLHALLHTGNESNFSKLLRGYHWEPAAWERFLDRAIREKLITKADYDFAQGLWDLLESIKPAAQQAHHEMYGYYFSEITAKAITTPWGEYRGGYVPAIADRVQSVDQAIREEKDLFDQGGNSFMFPTTGRGFTKARIEEYAAPLALDLTTIPIHLDKTMRFVHLEPRIKDAARLITNKGLRSAMDAMDSTAAKDMLVPWLQRSAQQTVSTPGRNRHADRLFRYLRKSTGGQIMVGNVINTLQQLTGFSSSLLKVKPRYMRGALVHYLRHPILYAEDVASKSPFMKGRTSTQVMEVQGALDDILLNPTKYEQARKFAERHGYFMQQGTQSLVDLITWGGAYDQAVAQDLNERMAVRAADSAVRQTQGSFAAEDLSAFEAGTPFTRAFTMFYSYFNMQANLLGTEFSKVAHGMGLKAGAGRAFYVYLVGFFIPAVLAESIVRGLGGFDPDDDDDYLNEALSLFFGSQIRTALAMVPGVGPITLAGINAFNDKWYDDRISTSPVVSLLESAVRAPHSLYQAMSEEGHSKRAVRDVLTFLGLVTGLPAAALARPAGYLADWSDGVAQPEDAGDVARGLLSGKDVNRTK